jgi:hypothetical protein
MKLDKRFLRELLAILADLVTIAGFIYLLITR